MNWRGFWIGLIVGGGLAVGLAVALQYAIWGYIAPDWYGVVAGLLGMVGGFIGSSIGGLRHCARFAHRLKEDFGGTTNGGETK